MTNRGVSLGSFDELVRFAQYYWKSGFCPDHIRSVESAVIIIQCGLERGVPPATSLQCIYVVNGRPALYGDIGPALVKNHPKYVDMDTTWSGDGDSLVATCKLWIKGREEPIVRSFSWKDAITGGHDKKQTYRQNPKRMLQWRAQWWAMRDAIPEALMGMLSVDEAEDLPPIQVINENEPPKTNKLAALVAKNLPEGMRGVPDPTAEVYSAAHGTAGGDNAISGGEDSVGVPENASQGTTGDREPGQDDEIEEDPPFDRTSEYDDDDQPASKAQQDDIDALKKAKTVAPRQFGAMLFEVGCDSMKQKELTASQAKELLVALAKLK